MSGLVGVRYEGERPMKYPTLPWDGAATGSAVARGLIPPIKPMMELHIRDTQICVGGDGRYYMTGSTGDNIWAFNDGVELWRSDDLKSWDYLGLVWSIERDGGWEKNWRMRKGVPFRALWAPEIHYVGGTYAIVHSMSRAGLAILKSVSGKPEGPYRHAFSPDAPLRKGIDATLFQDDDGSVWFTYGSAEEIVRLKDDLSGYAEEWRPTRFVTPELNPARHRDTCRAKGMLDLGFEGATLFKRDGVYYLGAVDFYEGRYSFCLATSDKLDGPYRGRHEAVPCGGGGNFFRDASGQWWCTFFGNDEQSPFREKPAIVAVDFDSAGRVMVATQQP
jgi:beta-xylosidase